MEQSQALSALQLAYAAGRQLAELGPRVVKALLGGPVRRGIDYDPYDRVIRERLADQAFDAHRDDAPLGTIARSRLLLEIIQDGFPTERLTAAYFENLDRLLERRERRATPGQVVLGLGSGRSGSTSLAAILGTVADSCCTHENPPLISWSPEPAELQFHLERFRRLVGYFPLVADVSHWWIHLVDDVFAAFANSRAVGVVRNPAACVESFMKIKGYGPGSYNHWAPYGNGLWAAAQWDPTYPTYPVPGDAAAEPDRVKFQMISRYVREYNDALRALAARLPDRVLVVKTEDLGNAAVQQAIFAFAGVRGTVAAQRLNVGTTADGVELERKF